MEIKIILQDKKRFLPLLLLGDEQESMIDRYLERGTLFALYDNGLKTVAVVTIENNNTAELKNLATDPRFQRRGYAGRMIAYLCDRYRGRCETMIVGTGDVSSILQFYRQCGFSDSHRVPDFFIQNYDHPIYEEGQQLCDMVYLKKKL